MGATAGRNTPRRDGRFVSHPLAAGKTIYAGTLVTLLSASGYACPGGTASCGNAVGVATDTVVSGGVDGDTQVPVEKCIARFANSASDDLITRADIGSPCFIVDDQTVAKTDNSAARKVAGTIVDVDSVGVWVDVGGYSIAITIDES
jgi:hypothetical protein